MRCAGEANTLMSGWCQPYVILMSGSLYNFTTWSQADIRLFYSKSYTWYSKKYSNCSVSRITPQNLLPVWNKFWLRVVKGYAIPVYKLFQKTHNKYGNFFSKILLPAQNPTGHLAPRRHHNFNVWLIGVIVTAQQQPQPQQQNKHNCSWVETK